KLDAALENMQQGLALFDAQQRIVLANRRYGELYGLSAEQVKPGTTLQEILAARAAKDLYTIDSPRRWLDAGVATFQEQGSDVLELADGPFISVLRRPLAEGGLVSTHEDITERQELSHQVERQNRLLKEQEQQLQARNAQLDIALNNMDQGLAMFGPDQR